MLETESESENRVCDNIDSHRILVLRICLRRLLLLLFLYDLLPF
jgi:hypothetical protein